MAVPVPPIDKPDPGYPILQSQETLPPYELDPIFDDPVIRKRVGGIIAGTGQNRPTRKIQIRSSRRKAMTEAAAN
jgi:hypothetical protein